MADVRKISEGTVADAEKQLAELSDAELAELHKIEEGGDNPRTTLLDAIHREQDSRKTAAASPSKAAKGVSAEDALKARNATMEPAGTPQARSQIETASKAR